MFVSLDDEWMVLQQKTCVGNVVYKSRTRVGFRSSIVLIPNGIDQICLNGVQFDSAFGYKSTTLFHPFHVLAFKSLSTEIGTPFQPLIGTDQLRISSDAVARRQDGLEPFAYARHLILAGFHDDPLAVELLIGL